MTEPQADAPTIASDATLVPTRLRGVWRRLSIEGADGSGDIATTVFWGQSDRLFCDLRIPAARPAAGARGFAGLSVDDAVALAGQEGFAGALDVSECQLTGDRCDWRRLIDFRPFGVPDAGLVALSGRMLVETGVDGSYVEHWWRDRPGAEEATSGRLDDRSGRIAITAGDVVMTALDRRPAQPLPGSLPDLAADAARAGDAGALAALLDCEIAYGRRSGTGAWTVELSTLPWEVGTVWAWPGG